MHFVLEEQGRVTDTHTDLSPELDLVRGEPVAITIVNHLDEPTSIHWHGIELEDSYMDGAPGFSGTGTHLHAGDCAARFIRRALHTPASGTFMYHAHVDDVREQSGRARGRAHRPRSRRAHQLTIMRSFLKGYGAAKGHPLEIRLSNLGLGMGLQQPRVVDKILRQALCHVHRRAIPESFVAIHPTSAVARPPPRHTPRNRVARKPLPAHDHPRCCP
jgi:hypothetical protein